MNFNDLILDVFKNEKEDEENLTEQGLLITPFLAFSAFPAAASASPSLIYNFSESTAKKLFLCKPLTK